MLRSGTVLAQLRLTTDQMSSRNSLARGQEEAGHRLFQDIPCVDTMNDGDDEEAKHDSLPAAAPPPENPTGGSNQEPSAEEAGTRDEFEHGVTTTTTEQRLRGTAGRSFLLA